MNILPYFIFYRALFQILQEKRNDYEKIEEKEHSNLRRIHRNAIEDSFEETNKSSKISILTTGFLLEFDSTDNARPLSFINLLSGENLLDENTHNPSKGFYLKEYNKTVRLFDQVKFVNENEYEFSMTTSSELLRAKFGGEYNYMTVEFTKFSGFPLKGETLYFELRGKERYLIKTVALDYMMADFPFAYALVTRYSLWETSDQNPLGKFALYQGLNELQEDDTLFDIWINEDLPHPRIQESTEWNRAAAEQWIDDWIDINYDMSILSIVPRTFEEHYEFLPYAKQMDAKAIHLNFRVWASEEAIDDVKTSMYPRGKEDFLKFKQDCEDLGMGISTHRMSGGLWPKDPYCKIPNVNPGLDHWGKMTLVSDITATDTLIQVKPADDSQEVPIQWTGIGARPPYPYPIIPKSNRFTCFLFKSPYHQEWIDSKSILDLGNDIWEIQHAKRGSSHWAKSFLINETEITGFYRGNIFYIPAANSELVKEVAKRYADINNYVQMIDATFDGAAWHMMDGFWGFEKFATYVYQNLDHPTYSTTSHGKPPWAWIEYRFNRVKAAFGGVFKAGGGPSVYLGDKSRTSVSLEEVVFGLQKNLLSNNRGISLAHSTLQNLNVFKKLGNINEILDMVKHIKRVSFAISEAERYTLKTGRRVENSKGALMGYKTVLKALWWLEDSSESSTVLFRKWYNTGTDLYNNEYYEGSEHGPINPRFYTQVNKEQQLVIPEAISSSIEKIRVVGRLLPRFSSNSQNNIDLMSKMGLNSSYNLKEQNDKDEESFDEKRLITFPIEQTDLSNHGGIGLYVDGDGSGATLVVRLGTTGLARDYAIPINFKGRTWVEVPNCEQGWRLQNWTWCGITKKFCDFSKIVKVSVGIGYIPANTMVDVTIDTLQALHEIHEPISTATITVGTTSITFVESIIQTYNHFVLVSGGDFTVYDSDWNVLFVENAHDFLPTSIDTFSFSSQNVSIANTWIEASVQASNETKIIELL